jgi:hypothetical protein
MRHVRRVKGSFADRRRRRWVERGVVLAVLAVGLVFIGGASADFGANVTKQCVTPTAVGGVYTCTSTLKNTGTSDPMVVTQVTDQILGTGHAADNVTIPINSATGADLTVTAPASCNASGCTLPANAGLLSIRLHYYTAKATDFPVLQDQVRWTYHQACTNVTPPDVCTQNPDTAAKSAASNVSPLNTSTATTIHKDPGHTAVTVVEAGSSVHDSVVVSTAAGQPAPVGNVHFDFFTGSGCDPANKVGAGVTLPLVAGGANTSTIDPALVQGPLAAGSYGYKASFLGGGTNGVFQPSTGDCEPLAVVDANIQITGNGVNRVGATHTFTGHVNVNTGSGFQNAPDGTSISFTIGAGGVGGFTSANPCTTSGGTGSCTITLVSNQTGLSVV